MFLVGCGPKFAGEPSKANNEVEISKSIFGGGARIALGAESKGQLDNFVTRGPDGTETSIERLTLEQSPATTIQSWVGPMQVYTEQLAATYDGLAKVATANWEGAGGFMRSAVGVAAAVAWRAGANGQEFSTIQPILEQLDALNQPTNELEPGLAAGAAPVEPVAPAAGATANQPQSLDTPALQEN